MRILERTWFRAFRTGRAAQEIEWKVKWHLKKTKNKTVFLPCRNASTTCAEYFTELYRSRLAIKNC